MNKPVADLAQRQQALDPAASFIVQAPAGSGKTELLIQRYLRLLSLVECPEEIVAITFTRKAAAEMRGRIIMALEQAQTGQMPADDYARQTWQLAGKVMEQDQKQEWRLVSNPNRLRIQTIDSLCAHLTRRMPLLSGFGAQPETIEDANEFYFEAASRTLAELDSGAGWSDAIAILLSHLDNDLPRVRNMLAGMLQRRDQWMRHVTSELRREELEGALKHLVETALRNIQQFIPDVLAGELLELLRYAVVNLDNEGSTSPIRYCLDADHLPGISVADLPGWQAITGFLLTADGHWRKAARADIGFPAASGSKAAKELRKAMKDRFTALITKLSEQRQCLPLLQEIRALPPACYSEAEWQLVNALCQLLVLAEAQLRVLFAEHNQVDFSSITRAAIQALGGAGTPSDLALYLDYQIKHILVDEYQDISINQYLLLQQMTAGWSADDRHTLFLVGDPMQSIYRFREAEVGIFLDTWLGQRLGQKPVTPLNITVNFRSRQGLVEWVNKAFQQILPETADVNRGAVSYVRADAFYDGGLADAVAIHPLPGTDERREAELVLRLVRETKSTDPGAGIAILVRNRAHLMHIVPCLRQAGLRFRAVEIESLYRRPAIQDLLALTTALHQFADRIAWLAVLRAPWCGLTLQDLHALAGGSKDMTIWDLMQDDSVRQSLSEDGRQRLLTLEKILQQAFTEQRRRRLSRWMESVWIRLGGPATLADASDLENARAFFELLDEYDGGGDLKSRGRFLEQVAGLYAVPDTGAGETLQIMTIHKSKGLEFDTVILPGLSRGSGRDPASLLLWAENQHAGHQDLLLAPVQGAGEKNSPIYDYVKGLQKEKQTYEDGRLLYVAATRARHSLHLIGMVEVKTDESGTRPVQPRSKSLLAHLWPVVKENFEQALDHTVTATVVEQSSTGNKLHRLSPDWVLPPAPESAYRRSDDVDEQEEYGDTGIEYEWAGETIMHIGTVVHQCLQCIAEEGTDGWQEAGIRSKSDYFKSALKRLGVLKKDIGWAGKRVEEALIKMIRDERGQWILARHTDQRNEYALSGLYQGKVIKIIIDRTFIDKDGIRWVVDYKTSRHEGANVDAFLDREQERYRGQLEKYAGLIQKMDDKPVKLGLYFPLLQGWREWEFCCMDVFESPARSV